MKPAPYRRSPPAIAGTGGLRAINAAENRRLCRALER